MLEYFELCWFSSAEFNRQLHYQMFKWRLETVHKTDGTLNNWTINNVDEHLRLQGKVRDNHVHKMRHGITVRFNTTDRNTTVDCHALWSLSAPPACEHYMVTVD